MANLCRDITLQLHCCWPQMNSRKGPLLLSSHMHTHILTWALGRGSWQCCPSTSGSPWCWRETLSPSHPSRCQSNHLGNQYGHTHTQCEMKEFGLYLTQTLHFTEVGLRMHCQGTWLWHHTALLMLHCLPARPTPGCYFISTRWPHEYDLMWKLWSESLFLCQHEW